MYTDLSGEKIWSKKKVVRHYASETGLQPSEALIFIRYREMICQKSVLDVGCGAGRTTAVLSALAASYTGVDYSAAMVEACRTKFPQKTFLCLDARDLSSFPVASFDFVIFSFNGIDCMRHPDRVRVLGEVGRVLKPEGIFVFSSHNRNWALRVNRPRLLLCFNIFTQIKNVYWFLVALGNYYRNQHREVECQEYAVTRSPDYLFSQLYYFIDRAAQARQAGEHGFEVIEVFDAAGNPLGSEDDDSMSCWNYYVLRKTSSRVGQ